MAKPTQMKGPSSLAAGPSAAPSSCVYPLTLYIKPLTSVTSPMLRRPGAPAALPRPTGKGQSFSPGVPEKSMRGTTPVTSGPRWAQTSQLPEQVLLPSCLQGAFPPGPSFCVTPDPYLGTSNQNTQVKTRECRQPGQASPQRPGIPTQQHSPQPWPGDGSWAGRHCSSCLVVTRCMCLRQQKVRCHTSLAL